VAGAESLSSHSSSRKLSDLHNSTFETPKAHSTTQWVHRYYIKERGRSLPSMVFPQSFPVLQLIAALQYSIRSRVEGRCDQDMEFR
jgi:hypothetical protein